MLIDAVLNDLDVPEERDRGGNPLRGSRLGRCARQSSYMLWPGMFPPEPLPARAKLVFRFGDLVHDLVREQFRRVLPGTWGLEEGRFHLKVPLVVAEAKHVVRLIATPGSPAQRWSILHGVDPSDLPRLGVVLDTAEPALYIPTHVDGVAEIPGGTLASVEIKSMATGSFRNALKGKVDYSYRVQMAVACEATGLDTEVYVAVRKDTCHLLEVTYAKRTRDVLVRFTKSSKLVEVFRSSGGEPTPDADWEAAEIEHPFEPGLLDEARDRVKRIISAQPDALPAREYGPSFTCAKCAGRGQRPCKTCKGSGVTAKLKNPCGPCQGRGTGPCKACSGVGVLAEALLPWQCTYCPYTMTCWPMARLEVTDRPSYWIDRGAFAQAGIRIAWAEPPVLPEPEPEREEPEDVAEEVPVEE